MSILAQLRARTRPCHDRLEACVDLERRCRTLWEYRTLLVCFSGFYGPVEAHLARCPGIERFDFAHRRKAPLLARDLQTLAGPDARQPLPLCTALPPLTTLPQAAGCLYVLEGATLGGQLIARHLRMTLGLDAQNGAAFFHCYGDSVGRRWKDFCGVLEDYALEDNAVREEIVLSAGGTFCALEQWLCATQRRQDF